MLYYLPWFCRKNEDLCSATYFEKDKYKHAEEPF